MGDSTNPSNWRGYQQGDAAPMVLDNPGYDFSPLNDPGVFSSQPLEQDQDRAHHHQTPSIEPDEWEILYRLRCATPTTKQSVLHLLRKSTTANTNSNTPSSQSVIDPAIQQYVEHSGPQDTTYNASDAAFLMSLEDDCIIPSSAADTPFEFSNDLHENAPTQSAEPTECPTSRPRPNTVPIFNDEHVALIRQMAEKPYSSAPTSQTVHESKNAMGSATICSEQKFNICDCGADFTTEGNLLRHKQSACTRTQDKIKLFTCLVNVRAPTCYQQCAEESPQNTRSATYDHRPKQRLRTTPYQQRADKMRDHLRDFHGWGNFSQSKIPQSWRWPLKRVLFAKGHPGPVWACELCDEELGEWDKDTGKAVINEHCVACEKGADARTARWPGQNSAQLAQMLGVVGWKMRDSEDENREYNPTSEEWWG